MKDSLIIHACMKEHKKDMEEQNTDVFQNRKFNHVQHNSTAYSFIKETLDQRKDLFEHEQQSYTNKAEYQNYIKPCVNAKMCNNNSSIECSSLDVNETNKRLRKQKEVITVEEICRILKLKEVLFENMPEHPVKIAEASFSEVFLINKLVYKIIPLTEWYDQSAFYKELYILDLLKNEQGVCKVADKFILKGKFPDNYIQAWDVFGSEENTNPREYLSNQRYGVIVMEDCGQDLEKYKFASFSSILMFVTRLLEVVHRLETKYKLEHRDLHWGNLLIKDQALYLIDFSFSRAETDKVVFTDLNAQEWMFQGDCREDIQFKVYIEMKESCRSNWLLFNQKSNLLWIRYLLIKILDKVEELPSDEDKVRGRKVLQKMVKKSLEYGNISGLSLWITKYVTKVLKTGM